MMTHAFTLFAALTLAASPAIAQVPQTDQRNAADSAKAFSLDLPPPGGQTQPLTPRAPDGQNQTLVSFTLDTPIEQLLADPRARAVLDADLPGMSADPNLPKFQLMSLRQLQPMTGGQMSNALLAKTGADLAATVQPMTGGQMSNALLAKTGADLAVAPAAQMTAPTPPATVSAATRKKMDSGR